MLARDRTRDPARHEVEIVRGAAIPLGDGGELACDVYLPAGAPPAPALLALLPYQKDGLGGAGAWQMHQFFAQRGYAVVLADFRGTGASPGRPRPPFHPGEADDGIAAVEWAAEQPWCDGSVGMWGHSYGAITAMRTAARGTPALKAILPVMGHLDSERDFVHPGGRTGCLGSLGMWGMTTLVAHLLPSLHVDAGGRWLERWRERVETEPYVIELVRRGASDPRWRDGVIDATAIDVPAFCVGGWRDLFCAGTLDAYERMSGPKKLLVGPWMHTMPQDSPFAPIDFLPLALRWWDRWLRGVDNGIDDEPPVRLYVLGRDTWIDTDGWPGSAAERSFYPAATGLTEHAGAAADEPLPVPADPTTGAASGLSAIPTSGFGLPEDQHADDLKAVSCTGEPLHEPLRISGRPRVRAAIVVEEAGDWTLVLKLADVAPDGRAMSITSGVARIDAGHPGQEVSAVVELDPTVYELATGHRLRLTASQHDFPRLWPSRGTAMGLVPDPERTTLTLPIAASEAGTEVSLAPPEQTVFATELTTAAEATYRTAHEHLSGRVTVALGQSLTTHTVEHEALLEVEQTVEATVPAGDATAARLAGHCTVRAATAAGELTVRAELVHERHVTVAGGEVRLDGNVLFQRRWPA